MKHRKWTLNKTRNIVNSMKHTITFIILVFCFFPVNSQEKNNRDKYSEGYIPKNLYDALTYLNCTWSEEDKEDFRTQNESDAVAELHMGTGLSIRNGWGLWAKRKNSLVRYFNSLGIFHPDDISSIILTSFHRQLNNIDIDLDKQVEMYKRYWKESEDRQRAVNNEVKRKFKQLSVGNTIKVPFGVTRDAKNISFSMYSNQSEIEDFDCIITGILVNKKKKKDNFILTIMVVGKWFRNEEDYMRKSRMEICERFSFPMNYFKIIND